MTISRRDFLKGMAAVAVLSVVPIRLSGQAKAAPVVALAGKRFYYMQEGEVVASASIPPEMVVVMAKDCYVLDCYFAPGSGLNIENAGEGGRIIGNYFDDARITGWKRG